MRSVKKLTEKQIAEIVDNVAHRGDGDSWAMQVYDLEVEDIDNIMADANYERCPECHGWVEAGELADDDCNSRPCYNCSPRRDEE